MTSTFPPSTGYLPGLKSPLLSACEAPVFTHLSVAVKQQEPSRSDSFRLCRALFADLLQRQLMHRCHAQDCSVFWPCCSVLRPACCSERDAPAERGIYCTPAECTTGARLVITVRLAAADIVVDGAVKTGLLSMLCFLERLPSCRHLCSLHRLFMLPSCPWAVAQLLAPAVAACPLFWLCQVDQSHPTLVSRISLFSRLTSR